MKKAKCLWVILLTVIFLFGCAEQPQADPTPTPETQTETETTSSTELSDEEKYPAIMECAAAEGFVTPESITTNTPCQIRLTKHRHDKPTPSFGYGLFIEINTGKTTFQKELKSDITLIPSDHLFLGDVDGDGIQEILVHSNTGGIGGYGLWYTWVLKVENDQIQTLFENFNEFDTGFDYRFLEGYQMEITNRITGYRLVFDVKEDHKKYLDHAKELPDDEMMIDPFYVFEPTDTDGDGVSEILCKQYTSIFGHADYTGNACSVLKFNVETQTFEVVDAWYEPHTDES